AEQSGTGDGAGQFDFRLRVQQSIEVFGLKKSNLELHARLHFVSVQRMAAENAQMAPQQPAGVKRSHDVGRQPRNSIHSSGDAKLRLSRNFLSDRSNARVEIAFGFDKLAISIFGLG